MKLLSIDVGIKNLAFCLFNCEGAEKNIQILAWDVINLSTNEPLMCSHPGCIQPAKFADVCFIYVCAKHAKTNKKTDKNKKKVPKKEQTMAFLQKQSVAFLKTEAQKYALELDKKELKSTLLDKLRTHLAAHYLETILQPKCNDVSLIDIGKHIQHNFDARFLPFETIDTVIIENQISPIASRMKTIQGMIAQYFIMSSLHVSNIEFISASNKLTLLKDIPVAIDVIKDAKITYKERKSQGIALCKTYLDASQLEYFEKHKKKDDLADAFLQGIWFHLHKM